MRNWSTDEKAVKKMSPDARNIWRLEQLINYGLEGEKLPIDQLKKYWSKINIDPSHRVFLQFLLHGC